VQPFTFFVSYRRRETAPIALLLKYEIEKRLQFVRVVVDVEDIQPGENFPARIAQLIDRALVTIVLIGSNWMPRQDQSQPREGRPASSDDDWIIKELTHSAASPINSDDGIRYGLRERIIIPIFVDCECNFKQFNLPTKIAEIRYMHSEHIDCASWPRAIGPLIERIAVNLLLKKRPDADEYPKEDPVKARTQPISDDLLISILNYDDYEGWYLDNYGNKEILYLVKTFAFTHFNQASHFMNLVANHCRILDHHPEWRNVFNHVTVSLTTWDARRRVTIYDLNLALFMNKAAKSIQTKSR
jgi:pterin-4a-carbinolamine dehydratase